MSLDLDAGIVVPSLAEFSAEFVDEIGVVSNRIRFLPNVARLLAATRLISRIDRVCPWEAS